MPSNDNHNSHDIGNYKTTLILHLKEKVMPRHQSFEVERSERFVEPGSRADYDVSPVQLGDRVVWVKDAGAELGYLRWMGYTDSHEKMAGVEFDNPIGHGTGALNNQQLFVTDMNRAFFLPLMSLVKADDFFDRPKDCIKKRTKNNKLIENCSSWNCESQSIKCASTTNKLLENSGSWTSVQQCGKSQAASSTSKTDNVGVPWAATSASKLDNMSSSRVGVPHTTNSWSVGQQGTKVSASASSNPLCWSNILVELDQPKNTLIPTSVDEADFKSEYVFSKPIADHSFPKGEGDNSKNNNITRKLNTNLSSYPIGDANLAEYHVTECTSQTIPSAALKPSRLGEGKIRHSYSQDFQLQSSAEPADLLDDLCGPTKKQEGPLDDLAEDAQPTSDLGVGSVVEVNVKGEPRCGVIRWIGVIAQDRKSRRVAGIEMEEECAGYSDGTFYGRRYFQCNPRKALFVNLSQCQLDSRFQDMPAPVSEHNLKAFAPMPGPVIPGAVPPINKKSGDLESICGKYRGIQGHHNSCYLDATLFSMFTFTSVFDSLLFRPPTEDDIEQYVKVQRVLREEIVNPLRQNLYVGYDHVMKLRKLLDNLSSVTGLTSEEKDPEEFLHSLVAQILRAEPYLKLSSGQDAYHHQLFVEKDEHLVFPTVQQLFEQSFLSSDIKLKEVPSCLIIQMPRFGTAFKMYPRILPSQLLDVTDVIEDSPRLCTVCGKLAEFECKKCLGEFGVGLESVAFCESCLETVHGHQRRTRHSWQRLTVPLEYSILQNQCPIPRLYMELFAVVCIETSHYVAFVKCGSGTEAPWCFFDSMADRKGEQDGHNIPEMVSCPNLPHWLSDEGAQSLTEIKDDRQLPQYAKRLLCDAYMCLYQSTDVMMYR